MAPLASRPSLLILPSGELPLCHWGVPFSRFHRFTPPGNKERTGHPGMLACQLMLVLSFLHSSLRRTDATLAGSVRIAPCSMWVLAAEYAPAARLAVGKDGLTIGPLTGETLRQALEGLILTPAKHLVIPQPLTG